jgi:hypothetical protein
MHTEVISSEPYSGIEQTNAFAPVESDHRKLDGTLLYLSSPISNEYRQFLLPDGETLGLNGFKAAYLDNLLPTCKDTPISDNDARHRLRRPEEIISDEQLQKRLATTRNGLREILYVHELPYTIRLIKQETKQGVFQTASYLERTPYVPTIIKEETEEQIELSQCETATYSKLTAEDIEKIDKHKFRYSDPRATQQDIQFLEILFKDPAMEHNIVDIANVTNPSQRDKEIEYLLRRIKYINYYYLEPSHAMIAMRKEDEGIISIQKEEQFTEEALAQQLLKFVILKKNKSPFPTRILPHLATEVERSNNTSTIAVRTLDGRSTTPLLVKPHTYTELPPNAQGNGHDKGIVMVKEYEDASWEAREVGKTSYEVSVDQQIALVKLLMSEGSVPLPRIYAKISSDEPLSPRNEQLLVYYTNKLLREWGVEATYTYNDDQKSTELTLQVASDTDFSLPDSRYDEYRTYEEERRKGKKRVRQPYHNNMHL